MARRSSGAKSCRRRRRAGPCRVSASWRRTSCSRMFFPARNRQAGPRSCWRMASSRWPVSARSQPRFPASWTVLSSTWPASREKPLPHPAPKCSKNPMACSNPGAVRRFVNTSSIAHPERKKSTILPGRLKQRRRPRPVDEAGRRRWRSAPVFASGHRPAPQKPAKRKRRLTVPGNCSRSRFVLRAGSARDSQSAFALRAGVSVSPLSLFLIPHRLRRGHTVPGNCSHSRFVLPAGSCAALCLRLGCARVCLGVGCCFFMAAPRAAGGRRGWLLFCPRR